MTVEALLELVKPLTCESCRTGVVIRTEIYWPTGSKKPCAVIVCSNRCRRRIEAG